ncbi:M20/M25/M40 family metallo-hydrolase [Erysipelothrix sp. D19-032]
MHACGHDGHTAGLLGATMILKEMKDSIHGNVKAMFQPAEETDGGAQPMIDEGILLNPNVDAGIWFTSCGDVEHGKLQVRYGAMYGAPDEFEIVIRGRGGHAASPNKRLIQSVLRCSLFKTHRHILTRRIDPVKPAVISFTKIHAW